MNSRDFVELGNAAARGFAEGFNVTEEEFAEMCEKRSEDRNFYEMWRHYLFLGDVEKWDSFEDWSRLIRNLPENIKAIKALAKEATKTMREINRARPRFVEQYPTTIEVIRRAYE